MEFNIFKDGMKINTIVASEAVVSVYCATNGYAFEKVPKQKEDQNPSAEDRLVALEDENRLLKAQVELQSQQQTFLEDCLLEMADIVYA